MVFLGQRRLLPLILASVTRHAAQGHSWIDCFDTDRTKIYDQSASYVFGGEGGNGFCAGYGAGYPGRGNASIGTGYTHKLLRNEVEAGGLVCESVGSNTYTDWRKRLVLAPEQVAYYAYLPNGHIVKDQKAVGTQHGIYWTGQVGTSLTSTHEMTPNHLLTGHTLDYDDGNCGETLDNHGNPSHRAGDGKPCIGSFVFPKDTPPGVYKMVWYWTFWLDDPGAYKDQNSARGYFGAAYSTCFEVEVVSGGSNNAGTTPPAALPVASPIPVAVPVAPVANLVPALTPPIVAASPPIVAASPPIVAAPPPIVAASPPIVAASAPIDTLGLPEAVPPSLEAQISLETPVAPMPAAATTSSPEMPPPPVSSGTVCRRRVRS